MTKIDPKSLLKHLWHWFNGPYDPLSLSYGPCMWCGSDDVTVLHKGYDKRRVCRQCWKSQ
jgi:hypothetical protein